MKNLNELNDVLFDTLKGINDSTVDAKKGNLVIGVSNAIINNAKVQLSAYKIAKSNKSPVNTPTFFGLPEADGSRDISDRYQLCQKVAKDLGFRNANEAIAELTAHVFNKKVDAYVESLESE